MARSNRQRGVHHRGATAGARRGKGGGGGPTGAALPTKADCGPFSTLCRFSTRGPGRSIQSRRGFGHQGLYTAFYGCGSASQRSACGSRAPADAAAPAPSPDALCFRREGQCRHARSRAATSESAGFVTAGLFTAGFIVAGLVTAGSVRRHCFPLSVCGRAVRSAAPWLPGDAAAAASRTSRRSANESRRRSPGGTGSGPFWPTGAWPPFGFA